MSSLLGKMNKSLTKVEIRRVSLETEEVTKVFDALSSCVVLEVLLLYHVDIPEYVFRFITYFLSV